MRFPRLPCDLDLPKKARRASHLLAGIWLAIPALATQSPGIGYLLQALEGPATVDAQGNTYTFGNVNGLIGSLPPTTPGALYSAPSTTPDVSSYLVKLDASGKVVYQTYMIGSAVDYRNNTIVRMSAIAADPSGNLFIAGTTSDAPGKTYVAEVNAAGTKLLYYQTFAGLGSVLRLAADSQGFVYLAGNTDSASFTATAGAFRTAGNIGIHVLKLNPQLGKIVYGVYLGGSSQVAGLGVDGNGNAYIAGVSTTIPVTTHAYQSSDGGDFVAEINASGSALVYAAYWPAYIWGIAVDSAGSVFLTGATSGSGTLPITPGAYIPDQYSGIQAQVARAGRTFIAKLNPGGESLAYSAVTDGGYGSSIVVDSSGKPTVAGFTNSRNFPSLYPIQMSPSPLYATGGCYYNLPTIQTPEPCGTGFIAKYDAVGKQLLWASYIGSSGIVGTAGMVGADATGNIYAMAGVPGLPLPGVTRRNQAGSLIKITTDGPPPLMAYNSVVSSADFTSNPFDGGLATIFGTGLTDVDGVVAAASVPLATELAGTSVWVNGSPAPILAVANVNGQQQINIQEPFTFPEGLHLGTCPCPGIVVHSSHGFGFALSWGYWEGANGTYPMYYSPPFVTAAVFGAFPGGAPSIVHGVDNSLVTASNPARAGEVIVIYATGLGAVSPAVPLGAVAPLAPLSRTDYNPQVVIGAGDFRTSVSGVSATVQFAGLAPSLVGVYQLNIVVPQVAPGAQSLFIQNADARSFGLPATIFVQ